MSQAIYDTTVPVGHIGRYTCPAICCVNSTNPGAHAANVSAVQWYPVDNGLFTSSGMDGHVRTICGFLSKILSKRAPKLKYMYI